MKISELQERQTVRFREGIAERTYVDWSEWGEGTLVCERNINKRMKKDDPRRIWLNIHVEDSDYRVDYSEDSFCPAAEDEICGCFVSGDYYLEVEGLTEK